MLLLEMLEVYFFELFILIYSNVGSLFVLLCGCYVIYFFVFVEKFGCYFSIDCLIEI